MQALLADESSEVLPFALEEAVGEEDEAEAREAALAAFVQLLDGAPPLRFLASDDLGAPGAHRPFHTLVLQCSLF